MAKGSARRTYARDARGRFASTNSSGTPKPRRGALKPGGGTLKARVSLGRSRAKLAAKDPADRSVKGTLSRRSQKGAVTRARGALRQAKKAARIKLRVGTPKGVIRKPRGKGRKAPPATPPAVTTGKTPKRIKGARPKGILSKGVKVKRNLEAGKRLKDIQAQQERSRIAATSSTKRSKPTETLQFPGPGIKGPSGAVLKAYTWQWQWESVQNREGDEVGKRVSNWDAAIQSAATGRNVVHQFVVEQNGKRSVVSAEGALRQLGFTGEGAKRFGTLKSSLKTLARLKMEQAVLQRQVDVIDRVRKETRTPKITVRKTAPTPWAKDGEYEIRMGQLSIVQPGGMKNGLVSRTGELSGLSKTLLLQRFQDEAVKRITGRRPMSIIEEMKVVEERIRRQQKKVDGQL